MSVRTFLLSLLIIAVSIGASAQSGQVIKISPRDNVEEQLQEALILSDPGSTIELAPGRYEFFGPLSIDIEGITLKGAGKNETVLSFKGQTSGSEGLLITSNNVRIEKLAVEDTPGDGIKAKGVDTVSFVDVRVEWTEGPKETNGAYGLYPVQSKNVLIDRAVVKGASDAGIYVGQSQYIIVRNSLAEYNVAGIEIENSYFADVHDNIAQHNTGGILVFDLPNLPQQGGHSIRLFNNKSLNNDVPNFAPAGNIVASVPKGTGIMLMSNRDIEVFGNEIGGNGSVNVLIVSYQQEFDDPNYSPLPQNVYVHNNIYGDGGFDPDKDVKDIVAPITGTPVPDIIWDGVVDGVWAAMFGPDSDKAIYVEEADDVSYANLQLMLDYILPWGASIDTEKQKYKGTLPTRDAVKLPQDQQQDQPQD
ncbi:parallel beta-helix domain-containing protein [Kordiimonas sp. SCSIO 12610]|uniref:parallel beta-helix domain-containing protein n=1 Tax=Kordiimonas sp. SCSIO 12610 TaxID=2829597 RepID=UPI00210CDD94|nr:parallel beta-helix domain-containing protein [Kordiimonas sp. SCSIO 12610]UTW55461.1 right-handed parallel beta-helix repeat-containing protein [Kordiimonas sp. SCSIO 12610]